MVEGPKGPSYFFFNINININMGDGMISIEQQLRDLADLVHGKPWGLDKGKPRVYLDMKRRDTKVFFSFPDWDETALGGAKFECFIDPCGQPAAWYTSQREMLRKGCLGASMALAIYQTVLDVRQDRDLAVSTAKKFLADPILDEDRYNKMASDLANGRVDEVIGMIDREYEGDEDE